MELTDPLPLSAIEHYAYCPRQAALIHVEGVWQSNELTAQGSADHEAVDRGTRRTSRGPLTTWFSLPVWHTGLGIAGVCDVVEVMGGQPVPVEHKPTLSRWTHSPAEQQLAAQAMCLEVLWSVDVTEGVLFTRRDQKRHIIEISPTLRDATRRTIADVREMIERSYLPPAVDDGRCTRCSLQDECKADLPLISGSPFEPAQDLEEEDDGRP